VLVPLRCPYLSLSLSVLWGFLLRFYLRLLPSPWSLPRLFLVLLSILCACVCVCVKHARSFDSALQRAPHVLRERRCAAPSRHCFLLRLLLLLLLRGAAELTARRPR
jgi:hypothetical protein